MCRQKLALRRQAGAARGLTASESLGPSAGWLGACSAGGRGKARVAGGRRTAFPQGVSSWQGACSLAGTRQGLVVGSWAQHCDVLY